MKKNLFVLGMVSVFALTGCHGTKKVGFAEFKEAVAKAVEKTPDVKEVKIKGEYKGDKVDFSAKYSKDEAELAKTYASLLLDSEVKAELFGLCVELKSPEAYTVIENEKFEYYTGNGFKVKNENTTLEWTSKALLAKAVSTEEGRQAKLTITWKK